MYREGGILADASFLRLPRRINAPRFPDKGVVHIQNQGGGWYRKRVRPGRKPDPGPPGVSSRCTDVHVNTAGLHAPAAMGLSGRLEFDSSNHVLC
jgi:hypothetical protein